MFKVNNEDTKLSQWRRPDVFIVNFEHVSHLVLVILLLTMSVHLLAGLNECNTAWS